ncbi:MAG TPA: hypothetical protein VF173_00335 [Thermoanaerobaculia bacterium]|nr:hypothetical protein [Thermoanaerobaculia bacterium]
MRDKKDTYDDTFLDWEGVSGACVRNAVLLPRSEAIRPELDVILARAKDLRLFQMALEAYRRVVTQRLHQALKEGRDTARKLRSQIKVELGVRNEHLEQFGIVPLGRRRRPRRVTDGTTPPAATGGPAADTRPAA